MLLHLLFHISFTWILAVWVRQQEQMQMPSWFCGPFVSSIQWTGVSAACASPSLISRLRVRRRPRAIERQTVTHSHPLLSCACLQSCGAAYKKRIHFHPISERCRRGLSSYPHVAALEVQSQAALDLFAHVVLFAYAMLCIVYGHMCLCLCMFSRKLTRHFFQFFVYCCGCCCLQFHFKRLVASFFVFRICIFAVFALRMHSWLLLKFVFLFHFSCVILGQNVCFSSAPASALDGELVSWPWRQNRMFSIDWLHITFLCGNFEKPF